MHIIRANYEMTREEAEMVNGLMDRAESDFRFYLLKMREERGWMALGFESFEQYGEVKRGLSGRHLYRLAEAAEVALSLKLTERSKIPETHLRPLASLAEDERRRVWEEATAKAEAEQKKLTAKMVQEAVDRLNAEKAELQSTLALVEQRAEDFRAESIGKGKALKEADQRAQALRMLAAYVQSCTSAN